MKFIFPLIFICFISCRQSDNNVDLGLKSDTIKPLAFTQPTQFTCGTSDIHYFSNILDEWESKHTGRLKTVKLFSTKQMAYHFFNILSSDSLLPSTFKRDELAHFYMPTRSDSIWLVMPVDQYGFIRTNTVDSLPIKVSFYIDDNKRFMLEVSSDSTIINKVLKIISLNRIGRVKSV